MSKAKETDAPLSGVLLRSQWESLLEVATRNAATHNNIANGAKDRPTQRAHRAQAKKWEALVALFMDVLAEPAGVPHSLTTTPE